MRRTAFLFLPLALLSGVAAQPPVPGTPAIPPTPPALPAAPAALPANATGELTLARFDPLNTFPATTQSAVRGAVLGSNWLARMSQSNGRFQVGLRPALRQPMEGDHDLHQAKAALALAQAARFTGNERQAAIAGQAILALLALTKLDADTNLRTPIAPSHTCNRVGFAAVLALAIFELPGADARLVAEAERLVEFIHRNLKTDGSVHYIDSLTDSALKIDPEGGNEHPGFALQAVAASNAVKPAAWKSEALKKAVDHYRAEFRARPHPMLAATLVPAFADHHLQSKSQEAAAAVFEMNDYLLSLQYPAGDPRHPLRAGGFKLSPTLESEPGFECGWHLQSLAAGYRVLRVTPDLARAERHRQAIADAVGFLSGLQYTEANTRHFENNYRAGSLIGGFHLTPTDGNLRVDATAAAAIGLLKCLHCGADRN
jgi:hypothetical protein